MSLLRAIVESKTREVARMTARGSTAGSPSGTQASRSERAIAGLSRRPGHPLKLIAEIKLRSPSAGPLSYALSPAARASAYAEAGASMISVLCDAPYFGGSWDDVTKVREGFDATGITLPILAKEFVVDPCQIEEARYRGADSVLLIARIVSRATLVRLVASAKMCGLEPLVEVVDERELEAAVESGAAVIGVNARDLDTLAMDGERAARVLGAIPPGFIAVHLSGVREADDVARVAGGRADAALIGEALMREDDPRAKLRAMVEAAKRR